MREKLLQVFRMGTEEKGPAIPSGLEDASSTQSNWPRALVVTVIAAFVVRLLVYHLTEVQTVVNHSDGTPFGFEAGRVARWIVLGKGLSSPLPIETGPTAAFTPIYPYLLALIFKIFGIYTQASKVAIVYANSAFSALTCVPIYWIGRRIFGPPTGLISARLWAFLPHAIYCPLTWIWDTSLSALLVALLFWATLALAESSRPRDWCGYGILWVITAMTNPTPLVLLPFFFGWVVLRHKARGVLPVRLAAITVLVFVAGVTPWTVRNYLVFGRIVPFRSYFGLELYLGNNPYTGGQWSNLLHPSANAAEAERFRSLGELAYNAEKQRMAMQFIRANPSVFLQYTERRIAETWTGTWEPLPVFLPSVDWQMQALFNMNVCRLFSLLTFVGLLLAYRGRLPEATPLGCALLVYPAIYYVTHTMLRYRHPIDPLMAVLAAYALYYPVVALAKRRKALATARLSELDQPTN